MHAGMLCWSNWAYEGDFEPYDSIKSCIYRKLSSELWNRWYERKCQERLQKFKGGINISSLWTLNIFCWNTTPDAIKEFNYTSPNSSSWLGHGCTDGTDKRCGDLFWVSNQGNVSDGVSLPSGNTWYIVLATTSLIQWDHIWAGHPVFQALSWAG